MKKLFVAVVILLVIGLIAFFAFRKPGGAGAAGDVARLVPADAVALLHVADVPRSMERWQATALYKIMNEPEMVAFLERPLSKVPDNAEWQQWKARLQAVQFQEGFVATTSLQGNVPVLVAGFRFKGRKEDVQAMLAEPQSKLRAQNPAGVADIVKHGEDEIETFTAPSVATAVAYHKDWCLVGNDVAAVKATLDRLAGRAGDARGLDEDETYRETMGELPKASDVTLFLRGAPVMQRLGSLMATSGTIVTQEQMAEMNRITGIGAALKADGEELRDAIFLLRSGSKAGEALKQRPLAAGSPDSVIYYGGLIENVDAVTLPDPAMDATGMLRMLTSIQQGLEAQGLSLAEFKAAFGPEAGGMIDWPRTATQPSLLVALDVRDRERAAKFVEPLMNGSLGLPAWVNQEIEGQTFWMMSQIGVAWVTPVLALSEQSLLFGLNLDSVKQALTRVGAEDAGLAGSALYREAIGKVQTPTTAFGFIDAKRVFEQVYGTARPLVAMAAAMTPAVSEYVDPNKLPATETVSQHLRPIVYSQRQTDKGLLVESVGPITFNQALVLVGGGASIAATVSARNAAAVPATPAITPAPPVTGDQQDAADEALEETEQPSAEVQEPGEAAVSGGE